MGSFVQSYICIDGDGELGLLLAGIKVAQAELYQTLVAQRNQYSSLVHDGDIGVAVDGNGFDHIGILQIGNIHDHDAAVDALAGDQQVFVNDRLAGEGGIGILAGDDGGIGGGGVIDAVTAGSTVGDVAGGQYIVGIAGNIGGHTAVVDRRHIT